MFVVLQRFMPEKTPELKNIGTSLILLQQSFYTAQKKIL